MQFLKPKQSQSHGVRNNKKTTLNKNNPSKVLIRHQIYSYLTNTTKTVILITRRYFNNYLKKQRSDSKGKISADNETKVHYDLS